MGPCRCGRSMLCSRQKCRNSGKAEQCRSRIQGSMLHLHILLYAHTGPILIRRLASLPSLPMLVSFRAVLGAMLDLPGAELACPGRQLAAAGSGRIKHSTDAHTALIVPCWNGRSDA